MQQEQLFRKLNADPEATILKNELLENPLESDHDERVANMKKLRGKTLEYDLPGKDGEKFLAAYEWVGLSKYVN